VRDDRRREAALPDDGEIGERVLAARQDDEIGVRERGRRVRVAKGDALVRLQRGQIGEVRDVG